MRSQRVFGVLGLIFLLGLKAQAYGQDGELTLEQRIEKLEAQAQMGLRTTGRTELRALLQLDSAVYKSDDDLERSGRLKLQDGQLVRRARLEARGFWGPEFEYRLQLGFGDDSVTILNAFVHYESQFGGLRFGNTKRPSSQESLRSSSALSFLERSLGANTFAPDRALGITYFNQFFERSFVMAGVYSGNTEDRDANIKSPFSYGARAGVDLWRADENFIALAGSYLKQTSIEDLRLRTELQTRVSRERPLDTGRLKDVRKTSFMSIDLQTRYESFRFISEMMIFKALERHQTHWPTNTFRAFTTEVGWVIAGGERRYDRKVGTFDDLRPHREWADGGRGAIELVARFSSIDLNDEINAAHGVQGGKGQGYTLGVNWALMKTLYTIAEVSQMTMKDRAGADDEKLKIFQLRLQASF